MKFSVLLSLYYKENPEFLRQSLESIFSQTLKPDEVVLVEDGWLTPELYEVVTFYKERHPEMKIVASDINRGLGVSLNEGLKHCSNELVARMDTDDICKPCRFERQVGFMEHHPDIAVLGAWIDEFQGNIHNIKSTRKLPEKSKDIFEFGKERNPMNHPVVMFRKSAVNAVGSYLPMPLFEDYYLWVRMLLKGYQFYNLQESLLYFRFTPDMFKRRGGIKYALIEIKFLWHLYKVGYVGLYRTCGNIIVRFITRNMPNCFRSWIYKNMLRR